MAYLSLVSLAAIFALLGFLLHAFYFSSPADVVLLEKVESLEKDLEQKQNEVQEAQDELVRKNTLVHSLEEKIRARNDEMEVLQRMVARQDEGIRQLQKDAVALRTTLGGFEKPAEIELEDSIDLDDSVPIASSVAREPVMQSTTERSKVEGAIVNEKEGDMLDWRENLNNILNILDSMEKEIDK